MSRTARSSRLAAALRASTLCAASAAVEVMILVSDLNGVVMVALSVLMGFVIGYLLAYTLRTWRRWISNT